MRSSKGFFYAPEYVTISAATARTQLTSSTKRTGLPKRPALASTAVSTICLLSLCIESPVKGQLPVLSQVPEPFGPFNVVGRTRRVTTGHNGDDGRRAILPVSACDINASVRAYI
jgi:hypothetical protein